MARAIMLWVRRLVVILNLLGGNRVLSPALALAEASDRSKPRADSRKSVRYIQDPHNSRIVVPMTFNGD